MEKVVLTGSHLDLNTYKSIVIDKAPVALSPDAVKNIETCRKVVDKIVREDLVRYGITTGFGKFSDVKIDKSQAKRLQRNIVLSHSVGVGKPLSEEIVRGMLLLKLNSFIPGYSGVRYIIAETLMAMLNKGVHPVVPEKGSVGASGDLAPLSHMALVVIGEGEAFYKGERMPGRTAMEKAGIAVVELEEKEGLALLNGTQTMTALAASALIKAETLIKTYDIAGAVSLEALRGTAAAFDERVQNARPHLGQIETADNYRRLLANSGMYVAPDVYSRVQDAYSLRCIPQVHGAVKDTFNHVKRVVEIEMNSVTDNPLVFPDKEDVISGGNFHGEPIAFVMDFMAIAISELSNISERRVQYMMDAATNDGLPPFLVNKGGLNSGHMMTQVTAAALVSDNKVFCHPASVDSIPTSANKEDHVSMGTNAARKLHDVLENVKHVAAIELLCATQALDLRLPLEPSTAVKAAWLTVRKEISFMAEDRNIHLDIMKMTEIVENRALITSVENSTGTLLV